MLVHTDGKNPIEQDFQRLKQLIKFKANLCGVWRTIYRHKPTWGGIAGNSGETAKNYFNNPFFNSKSMPCSSLSASTESIADWNSPILLMILSASCTSPCSKSTW